MPNYKDYHRVLYVKKTAADPGTPVWKQWGLILDNITIQHER